MRIIPESEFKATELAEWLKQGQTLAYPTETSYGLGCDVTNQDAVNSIFAIKARDPSKPLLVIVADLEQIKPYIVWDERLEQINAKYWPGPLTVVVPAQLPTTLAAGVVSADNWLAFRVTSHPVAQEIVRALGKPLVSTSVNMQGEPSLFSPVKIIANFSNNQAKPDILLSTGDLPEVPGSTIIKLTPGTIEVLRSGAIIPKL